MFRFLATEEVGRLRGVPAESRLCLSPKFIVAAAHCPQAIERKLAKLAARPG
jgi:hypothetical protein